MPGSRLSLEERRRIEAWLGQGVHRAEIARRLARPRSTIGREVVRNGGADAYRAERAHRTAAGRARRSPAPPAGSLHGDEEAAFTARFVAMMVETGFPAMPARVLGHLFVDDAGRATAAELAERLAVSPASVSKAVAYLERIEVIRRERTAGRRECYVLDDDVWFRAWAASIRAIHRWADATAEGAEVLGPSTPAGARLERTGRFFALLADDMAAAAAYRRRTLT